MYKSKSTKSKKTKLPLILALALLLLGLLILENRGVTTFYEKSNGPTPQVTENTINYDPPSSEEIQRAVDEKINNIENRSTSDANQTDEVKIQDLYQDSDTRQVVVKTELYGVDWDTCTLSFTKGSLQLVKTAQTLYQQPYYTCMGFAVESSEFSQSGEWKVELSVSKSSGQATKSAESTVYIQP